MRNPARARAPHDARLASYGEAHTWVHAGWSPNTTWSTKARIRVEPRPGAPLARLTHQVVDARRGRVDTEREPGLRLLRLLGVLGRIGRGVALDPPHLPTVGEHDPVST